MSIAELLRRIACGKAFAYASIVVAFATMYALHFGIWGNLVADTFRDQWVFHALAHGRTLYRDVTYLYGPVPPYLMAGLQRVFGEHLSVSTAVGTLLCAAAAALLYRTARLSLARPFAATVAIVFLCVFGIPSYAPFAMMNFILPYSVASTMFAVAHGGALFLFLRWIRTHKTQHAVGWAALLALGALCRPDTAVAAYAAYAFAALALGSFRAAAPTLIASGATAVGIFGVFFAVTGSFAGFCESVIAAAAAQQGSRTFAAILLGTAELRANLTATGLNTVTAAAGIATIAGLARVPRLGWALTGIAGAACAVLVFRAPADGLFRHVPVFAVIIALAGYLFRDRLRTADAATNDVFVCSVVSAALLAKIALTMTTWLYAFYLILPALVAAGIVLFRLLPAAAPSRPARIAVIAASSAIVAAAVFGCLRISCALPITKSYRFTHAKGNITGHHPLFVQRAAAAYAWITANVPPAASLVTVPEFESAYFYTGRETPLRYDVFTPAQLAVLGGEDKLCAMLREHRVDYVLVHSRDYREYGADAFGVNPGTTILDFLGKEYTPVFATDGDLTSYNDFAIVIFKRKGT